MSAPAFRLQADNAIRYQGGRIAVVSQAELEPRDGATLRLCDDATTLVEKREGEPSLFGLKARQLSGVRSDDPDRRVTSHLNQ